MKLFRNTKLRKHLYTLLIAILLILLGAQMTLITHQTEFWIMTKIAETLLLFMLLLWWLIQWLHKKNNIITLIFRDVFIFLISYFLYQWILILLYLVNLTPYPMYSLGQGFAHELFYLLIFAPYYILQKNSSWRMFRAFLPVYAFNTLFDIWVYTHQSIPSMYTLWAMVENAFVLPYQFGYLFVVGVLFCFLYPIRFISFAKPRLYYIEIWLLLCILFVVIFEFSPNTLYKVFKIKNVPIPTLVYTQGRIHLWVYQTIEEKINPPINLSVTPTALLSVVKKPINTSPPPHTVVTPQSHQSSQSGSKVGLGQPNEGLETKEITFKLQAKNNSFSQVTLHDKPRIYLIVFDQFIDVDYFNITLPEKTWAAPNARGLVLYKTFFRLPNNPSTHPIEQALCPSQTNCLPLFLQKQGYTLVEVNTQNTAKFPVFVNTTTHTISNTQMAINPQWFQGNNTVDFLQNSMQFVTFVYTQGKPVFTIIHVPTYVAPNTYPNYNNYPNSLIQARNQYYMKTNAISQFMQQIQKADPTAMIFVLTGHMGEANLYTQYNYLQNVPSLQNKNRVVTGWIHYKHYQQLAPLNLQEINAFILYNLTKKQYCTQATCDFLTKFLK